MKLALDLPDAADRPQSALQNVLQQAFFDVFERQFAGAVVVNTDARVVWMNPHYAEILGFADPGRILGERVDMLLPNTRLTEVLRTGEPILLDFMTHRDRTFVVSRFPIRDDQGCLIGAGGIMLYDAWQPLKPLMDKFSRLQQGRLTPRRDPGQERTTRYSFADVVGESPACRRMKELGKRAAGLDATVLLLGETGSGKELLAQSIHAASMRASQAFVALNIAAIPDTLLEAELFGAAPGAYTGADRRGRDGKFKLADGGSIFLDEIGDLPLSTQAKLLRVLQELEIEPLGANQLIKIDVRVIAATSRDLPAMVSRGEFRADLYYRLNVLPIRLPPLRERVEDIPALATKLLEDIHRRSGAARVELSGEALNWLATQPWPGNIRELRNALEQATMLADRDTLLPADFLSAAAPTGMAPVTLAEAVRRAEIEAIRTALQASAGNKAEAARLLGIGRATLYEKLANHGLDRPQLES
ncbi:PAS domain-containing protein [Chitinimonas arctica]|uniref:PAS domain-containing protein n=1 Tax=Chitinimonas arctica TaxID=2594795 RepID=A0A516SBZ9_9NEIS|nr:sigma 54-interacting transcriptional regulator [Chitinimonas arctica]QDQ25672.1 PAS domain-containing protein [Chitinimonas arctica]